MARATRLPWPRLADDGVTALGIDLTTKHGDVRRLVIAGFAASAAARGVDVDDLVQEVLAAVWRRNHYPSAYDPRRGPLGHYVHRVARCQLINIAEAGSRHRLADEAPEVADASPSVEARALEAERAHDELEDDAPPLWLAALREREAVRQRPLFTSADVGRPGLARTRPRPSHAPRRPAPSAQLALCA